MKTSTMFPLLAMLLAAAAGGAEPAGKAAAGKGPVALPGGPAMDLDAKAVLVPVELVNDKGGLEFVLSQDKTKDYESLLSSTVPGSMLHFALVGVGLEPSSFSGNEADGKKRLEEQAAKGSRLEITVRFEGDKEPRPLEDCLLWGSGNAVKERGWFFAGSFFDRPGEDGQKVYAANRSLNLIAAYAATDMVVGPCFKALNPYEVDSYPGSLVPNKKALPAVGTKGTLVIRAAGTAK